MQSRSLHLQSVYEPIPYRAPPARFPSTLVLKKKSAGGYAGGRTRFQTIQLIEYFLPGFRVLLCDEGLIRISVIGENVQPQSVRNRFSGCLVQQPRVGYIRESVVRWSRYSTRIEVVIWQLQSAFPLSKQHRSIMV